MGIYTSYFPTHYTPLCVIINRTNIGIIGEKENNDCPFNIIKIDNDVDLQEEVGKQMAELEGERSGLQMKIEEFQSRNQRERNELELDSKELKRSVKAFEESRKTWEREKKSEIQYIENRKQELEVNSVL